MTQADLDRVAELGIKTQIDLRRDDEIRDQGRGPLEEMGSRYAHHPVMPNDGSQQLNNLVGDTGISGARYLGYLQFDPAPWVGIFDIMADADQLPLFEGETRRAYPQAAYPRVKKVTRNGDPSKTRRLAHGRPSAFRQLEFFRPSGPRTDSEAVTRSTRISVPSAPNHPAQRAGEELRPVAKIGWL